MAASAASCCSLSAASAAWLAVVARAGLHLSASRVSAEVHREIDASRAGGSLRGTVSLRAIDARPCLVTTSA